MGDLVGVEHLDPAIFKSTLATTANKHTTV